MKKYEIRTNVGGTDITYRIRSKELYDSFLYWNESSRYYENASDENAAVIEANIEEMNRWQKKWNYPSDHEVESGILIFKTGDELLKHGRCLFHGAVLSWKGTAILFTAKSGTGKTTQMLNWKDIYGHEIEVLNGDKPALSIEDGNIMVYPTPWRGKEKYGKDDFIIPLGAVIVLEQGKENSIRRLTEKESVISLYVRFFASFPNEETIINAGTFLEQMIRSVPVYKLINKGDYESSLMTYDRIKKELFGNGI